MPLRSEVVDRVLNEQAGSSPLQIKNAFQAISQNWEEICGTAVEIGDIEAPGITDRPRVGLNFRSRGAGTTSRRGTIEFVSRGNTSGTLILEATEAAVFEVSVRARGGLTTSFATETKMTEDESLQEWMKDVILNPRLCTPFLAAVADQAHMNHCSTAWKFSCIASKVALKVATSAAVASCCVNPTSTFACVVCAGGGTALNEIIEATQCCS